MQKPSQKYLLLAHLACVTFFVSTLCGCEAMGQDIEVRDCKFCVSAFEISDTTIYFNVYDGDSVNAPKNWVTKFLGTVSSRPFDRRSILLPDGETLHFFCQREYASTEFLTTKVLRTSRSGETKEIHDSYALCPIFQPVLTRDNSVHIAGLHRYGGGASVVGAPYQFEIRSHFSEEAAAAAVEADSSAIWFGLDREVQLQAYVKNSGFEDDHSILIFDGPFDQLPAVLTFDAEALLQWLPGFKPENDYKGKVHISDVYLFGNEISPSLFVIGSVAHIPRGFGFLAVFSNVLLEDEPKTSYVRFFGENVPFDTWLSDFGRLFVVNSSFFDGESFWIMGNEGVGPFADADGRRSTMVYKVPVYSYDLNTVPYFQFGPTELFFRTPNNGRDLYTGFRKSPDGDLWLFGTSGLTQINRPRLNDEFEKRRENFADGVLLKIDTRGAVQRYLTGLERFDEIEQIIFDQEGGLRIFGRFIFEHDSEYGIHHELEGSYLANFNTRNGYKIEYERANTVTLK